VVVKGRKYEANVELAVALPESRETISSYMRAAIYGILACEVSLADIKPAPEAATQLDRRRWRAATAGLRACQSRGSQLSLRHLVSKSSLALSSGRRRACDPGMPKLLLRHRKLRSSPAAVSMASHVAGDDGAVFVPLGYGNTSCPAPTQFLRRSKAHC